MNVRSQHPPRKSLRETVRNDRGRHRILAASLGGGACGKVADLVAASISERGDVFQSSRAAPRLPVREWFSCGRRTKQRG